MFREKNSQVLRSSTMGYCQCIELTLRESGGCTQSSILVNFFKNVSSTRLSMLQDLCCGVTDFYQLVGRCSPALQSWALAWRTYANIRMNKFVLKITIKKMFDIIAKIHTKIGHNRVPQAGVLELNGYPRTSYKSPLSLLQESNINNCWTQTKRGWITIGIFPYRQTVCGLVARLCSFILTVIFELINNIKPPKSKSGV